MVWTYTRNANHWTKGIVSIDGLDKLGKAGQTAALHPSLPALTRLSSEE